MHTRSVSQKFFSTALPGIHQYRRTALVAAVDSVAQGAQVGTAMGRGLSGSMRIKHRVKRMDRLVGNSRLDHERSAYYAAITACFGPVLYPDHRH